MLHYMFESISLQKMMTLYIIIFKSESTSLQKKEDNVS